MKEIKIKVESRKDFILNDDDCNFIPIKKDNLIGFFDNLEEAKKAANKYIEEQEKKYELVEVWDHEIEEADIWEDYASPRFDDGKYYTIDIYYTLVLQ